MYFSVRERNFNYGGTYGIGAWFVNARSHFFGYTRSNTNWVLEKSAVFNNLERIVGEISLIKSDSETKFPLIKKIQPFGSGYWTSSGFNTLYNCKEFKQSHEEGVLPYFINLSRNILIKDYNCIFKTGSGNKYGLFQYNTSLQTLSLYASGTIVRTIQANALLNCYSLKELHLVYFEGEDTPIVTLANVNAFSGCPSDLKIYVPAELVDAYKTATNWSTYADQIFAEPEVEATE
jgi:hypothetical protein